MNLKKSLARSEAPEPSTVIPLFGDDQPMPPDLKRKIRGPIVAGCAVIGVGVTALLAGSAISSVAAAVVAPGVVRVEANSKTLKSLEGGVIRRIHVREGQRVSRGQTLIEFDQLRTGAQVEVLRSSYHNLLAERARYVAELSDASAIQFPPELITAASTDPSVAAIIRTQQDVFQARRILVGSQQEVLAQRAQQLETRITGLDAQVESTDEQDRLIGEELEGMKELNAKGYAPLNKVRALERETARLKGSRGAQVAEITRAREAIGESRIELAKVRQQRISDAAEKLREIEVRMADLLPRVRAADQSQDLTRVTAPVDGYVLNLTQFTEGGVAGPGETLMQIVPANAPLVIDARIRPGDVDQVRAGMEARVRLSGLSRRVSSEVKAEVLTVSADRKLDERKGDSYFDVQLRILPGELDKFAGTDVRLNPGMPADTYIITGQRTVLEFVVGPLRDALADSFHEQ